MPSPADPPPGCNFHTRCWLAQPICSQDEPELTERPDLSGTHPSACHFEEESMMTSTRTHTE